VLGTSTVLYMHADHLGSTSVVTSQAGAVVSSQQFDPWGKVRSGGITQTKINYTGQRKDDTGLHYYHARYYDSSVGRFNSADSIVPGGFGDPQSLGRYNYVKNNPANQVDPSGHVSIPVDPGSELADSLTYDRSRSATCDFPCQATGIFQAARARLPAEAQSHVGGSPGINAPRPVTTHCEWSVDIEVSGGVILFLGAAMCTNQMALMVLTLEGIDAGIQLVPGFNIWAPYADVIPPIVKGCTAPCGRDGKYLTLKYIYGPTRTAYKQRSYIMLHSTFGGVDIYGNYNWGSAREAAQEWIP
jgi:RHS repeat-associated protein